MISLVLKSERFGISFPYSRIPALSGALALIQHKEETCDGA